MDTLAVVEGESNNRFGNDAHLARASVEAIGVKITPFENFSRALGRFERRRRNGI